MAAVFDDLLATFAGPPMPMQPRLPVKYDRALGVLELSGCTRVVPEDASNRKVLEQFVDLVSEVRAAKPTASRHLRRLDITALAAALDVSDRQLEAELREVLEVQPALAKAVAQRLARSVPAGTPVTATR